MQTPVTKKERAVLRDLAKRVADIAQHPKNREHHQLWLRHNRLDKTRPMIRVCPEGAWCELIPEASLQCSSPWARRYELDLRKRIYHWENIRDDSVISDGVWACTEFVNTGWGVKAERIEPGSRRGACGFEHPLKTPGDFRRMRPPKVHIDEAQTRRNLDLVQDVFGDILQVKLARTLWDLQVDCWMVDTLVALRGNEQFMLDMYERPNWLHEVLTFMTESIIDLLKHLEENVDLELNNGPTCDGMGSFYLTDELPQPDCDGGRARLKDLWGVADAQEFAAVSPRMHYEFALQYQVKVLSLFGLTAYGCCEPLHEKLHYVKQIPHLRRISISPWADVRKAAEQLQDKYIFSWKPNPVCVAGPTFHPQRIRQEIAETVKISQECNCVLEITLKDTHTVNHQPQRLQQWVRLARQATGAETPAAEHSYGKSRS